MALLKDYYNEQFDVTIANAYWKIDVDNGIEGGKIKLRVRLSCYRNKTIADTNVDKFVDFVFEFTPDLESVDNFLKQAYNYAKTLPEFNGAVDA